MTTSDLSPLTRARPRRVRRSGLRAAELALAVFGLVAAALVVIDVPGPVRAVVVFAAVILLPGWTILRRLPSLELAARLILTVVGSIVVMTLLSLAMVWLGVWHPRGVVTLILVATSVTIAAWPVSGVVPAEARAAGGWAPRALVPRVSIVPWISLGAGAAAWIAGLAATNSTDLGQLGLLAEFPPYWYAAVIIAFVVALFALFTARRAHGLLAASIGLLIVILYGSATLVENAPRLPWVYKHIAVTNYIFANGSVDPSIDLYNRWPGFFAFSATVGGATGLHDATSYAGFAEVFFALVDAVLVLALARAVSRHRRWAWTTVLVFSVGNWVGQNYYSPQAFAFVLYLAMALIVVTALGSEPGRLMRRVEGLLARPARRNGYAVDTELVGTARSGRAWILAVVAVLALQAVIVASHQLTPYVAILGFLPLFLVGYLRPLWVGLLVVALPVIYLVPNLDYVESRFGLFSSFNPLANASESSVSSVGVSAAATLQSHGVVLLTGIAVLLALAGFVRRILNGHVRTTLVVAWLAFAPILTLLGQTYGGEGKFRIFLFGLPFYAMGVSWLFWTKRGSEVRPGPLMRRIRGAGLVASLSVVLTLFVGTYFQPEASLRVSSNDVKAALWLDHRFQPDDTFFSVTDTFPELIGPDYPNYLQRYEQSRALTEIVASSPADVSTRTLAELIEQRSSAGHTWVAFSDTQTHTAAVAGTFTAADLQRIEASVARSSSLRYDRDGVRIYESR